MHKFLLFGLSFIIYDVKSRHSVASLTITEIWTLFLYIDFKFGYVYLLIQFFLAMSANPAPYIF